ncbi:hypothetical protein [Streptomyces sp. R41]|uniref:Uncharacterized protein n=1 Tax=Streptomyces sp. R41 TaxID=3238632 RepID=A0AB39R6A1_9ACTN
MAADLLVEIGPCDDDAFLFLNGRLIVQTGLGEVRRFQREMPDGSYNFRLNVKNTGAWRWQARLILTINGETLADVNEVGGSGLYTGDVYDQEWQCRIENGKLVEF